MAHYCKYHPLEHAAWHCARCHIHACETCSPDPQGGEAGVPHYCPVCNGEMAALGDAHAALPFWQHLGAFLQYPFSLLAAPLLLLALLIPLLVPEGIPLLVARLVFLGLLMKYAYTALEYVASGRLAPIMPAELGKAENTDFAIKLAALVGAMAVGVGFVFGKSAFYGSLLVVFGVVALPAMVMAASIDKNVASATGSDQLKAVLAGVGFNYAVLVLLLLALLAGLQSFVSLFADILPEHVSTALGLVAYSYFLMVLMVASGYLLFQYQRELGFTPAHGEKRIKKGRTRQPDLLGNQVELYLKEGMYAKAMSLLHGDIGKKSATLSSHERYHKLAWSLNDDNALGQHAVVYFKALLENGRDAQVLALMRGYLSRDSAFRPEDPDTCLQLAETFVEMKEYKLAVHMLNGMHKDSPHYARLPEAYLLAARVLNENLGMPQKALALIQFLEGRFMTHKSFPEIQAYKGRMLAIRA